MRRRDGNVAGRCLTKRKLSFSSALYKRFEKFAYGTEPTTARAISVVQQDIAGPLPEGRTERSLHSLNTPVLLANIAAILDNGTESR